MYVNRTGDADTSQIFGPQSNWIARAFLIGTPTLFLFGLYVAGAVDRSSLVNDVGNVVEQPIPFSHKHHAGELGIDCRYCHTQVERSSIASLPSTEVCMTCHTQIWKDAPMLKPVHLSNERGTPIHWNKVTKIPDFVYFNHSIHVQKGVGCITCHGNVGQMSLTRLAHPMVMEFCLNCHREPEKFLRPREQVFALEEPRLTEADQKKLGNALGNEYGVEKNLDCVTCHR